MINICVGAKQGINQFTSDYDAILKKKTLFISFCFYLCALENNMNFCVVDMMRNVDKLKCINYYKNMSSNKTKCDWTQTLKVFVCQMSCSQFSVSSLTSKLFRSYENGDAALP